MNASISEQLASPNIIAKNVSSRNASVRVNINWWQLRESYEKQEFLQK